jgi:uncharacterized protein YlxW (UPF0749 family)
MTPDPRRHEAPAPPTSPPGRRPDESMTLLISILERPLDPGYATSADRREAQGLPRSTGTRTVTVLVATIVTGLLLSLGALALRRPSTSVQKARAELISQVESRRAAVDRQSAQLHTLQAQVDSLQAEALAAGQGDQAKERLATLGLAAGADAVTGPGIRLVIDDAPGSDAGSADANPRTQPGSEDGKVLSKDLQVVVNGLWQAGAEAIAVNGQRLTSQSAIRFAGEAILVNFRPLTRPYTITAIGGSSALQSAFAETGGGSYLRALQDNYGIRASMGAVKSLTLPAAASLTVRSATVPRPSGGAAPRSGPSSATTTEGSP